MKAKISANSLWFPCLLWFTCSQQQVSIEYSTREYRKRVASRWHNRWPIFALDNPPFRCIRVRCAQSYWLVPCPFAVKFAMKTSAEHPMHRHHWTPHPAADWMFECDRKIHLVGHSLHPCYKIRVPHFGLRWLPNERAQFACQQLVQMFYRNDTISNVRIHKWCAACATRIVHQQSVTILGLDMFR